MRFGIILQWFSYLVVKCEQSLLPVTVHPGLLPLRALARCCLSLTSGFFMLLLLLQSCAHSFNVQGLCDTVILLIAQLFGGVGRRCFGSRRGH